MPKLKCNAIKCLYNQSKYCVRNRIHVQGSQAITEDETKCGTFKLRTSEDKENYLTEFARIDEANEHLSINCDCVKCKFNEKDLCKKEFVKISGINADSRQDTVCESFEKDTLDNLTK